MPDRIVRGDFGGAGIEVNRGAIEVRRVTLRILGDLAHLHEGPRGPGAVRKGSMQIIGGAAVL